MRLDYCTQHNLFTIVVFQDYRCPFCELVDEYEKLQAEVDEEREKNATLRTECDTLHITITELKDQRNDQPST